MSKLRPCPFCGGTPKLETNESGWSSVVCPDCGANMYDYNLEMLEKSWNRRTEDNRLDHARRAVAMLEEMTGYLEKESKTCWSLMVNADDTNCLVSALIPIFKQLTADAANTEDSKEEI